MEIEAGKQKRFLSLLATCGNVSHAAKTAGVPRCSLYIFRAQQAEFAAAWAQANEAAADLLEAEARRRAVRGIFKPIYQGGEEVGKILEYSDVLLMCLLRAARRSKYGQVRVDDSEEEGTPAIREIVIERPTPAEEDTDAGGAWRSETQTERTNWKMPDVPTARPQ